jgi:hypothetical protein
VVKFADRLGDAFEDVLGDIFGIGMGEPGAPRATVDEASVEAVKFLPTRAIVPVAHSVEQRRTRQQGVAGVVFHGVSGPRSRQAVLSGKLFGRNLIIFERSPEKRA